MIWCRHLFLPISTKANPTPDVLGPGVIQAQVVDQLRTAGAGVPRCAFGCTCRDWVFSAQLDTGEPGPAAHGCKHMIFYELCRQKADQLGYAVVEYPAGVVP